MDGNNLKRNVLWFYLYELFGGLSYIYDLVIVVYYQSFGLTFTQIGLILGMLGLSTLLFEVPSGAYADIHGKKKSMIIGGVFYCLSFLVVIVFPTFYWFLFAAALLGASFAFSSGAWQSLLYETLKTTNEEDKYLKIRSNIEAVFLGASVIVAYFGPYLFSIDRRWPIFATVVFGVVSLLFMMLIKEKPVITKKTHLIFGHLKQILEALKFTLQHKVIIWLIAFSALGISLQKIIGEFISIPYMLDMGFVMAQIAIIEMIATSIQVCLVYKLPRIKHILSEKNAFIIVIVGGGLCLLLTFIVRNYLISVLFGTFWGLMTFRGLIVENSINNHLVKKNRATVLSIHSMMTSLAGIIAVTMIGVIADKTSTIFVVIFTAIMSMGIGLILIAGRNWWERKADR